MTTIDERVVEMRFDNKQFEANAKSTLSTLEKLKAALHLPGAAKGLEEIDRAAKDVNLSGIAAGIEALEKRFSTLGIVGMTVIMNITNSLMNSLGKAINFVSDSIVSGGIRRAMNIENAHFQLQALLKDEERVQAVMKNANDSVTGTAYAYDEAAKAASQFAASGIQEGEQMMEALMGVVGVAAMTNSEYEGISRIFTTVAGNGRLMGDQLLQLSSRGLNAAATIADYFSKVNQGSIEASDNVKASIRAITKSTQVSEGTIREAVSKGKISFDVFASAMNNAFGDAAMKANTTFTGAFSNMKAALARIGAGFISPIVAQESEAVRLFNALRLRINDIKSALVFDEEVGNTNALSKQFTDSVLKMAGVVADFMENADMTKPMQGFYYGLESIKNVAKGIYSVIRPVGRGLRDAFLVDFSMDTILTGLRRIEQITEKFRLSEKASQNLRDTLKGLGDVTKFLVETSFNLLKRGVTALIKPLDRLGDGFLAVTGETGRYLTRLTRILRESPAAQKAYEGLSKAIDSIRNAFKKLNDKASPYIENIKKTMDKWLEPLERASLIKVQEFLRFIGDGLSNLSLQIDKIDLSIAVDWIVKFTDVVRDLWKGINWTQLKEYGTDFKNFFVDLSKSFSYENLISKLESFQEHVDDFITWFKEKVSPFFEGVSFGGLLAGGTGVGIVYSMSKISTSLDRVTLPIGKISKLLTEVSKTMKAQQLEAKANAFYKVAKGIAILAASLLILSFADVSKIQTVSIALAALVGAAAGFSVAITGLIKTFKIAPKVEGAAGLFTRALDKISGGIKSAIKDFGRAKLIKSIGTAFKNLALAVGIIALAIVGLGLMYKKDKEAMDKGVELVTHIALILVGVVGAMSVVGKITEGGMSEFSKAALSIIALSLALSLTISALNKLFKMDLPSDWKTKAGILAGIFVVLGGLTYILGKSTNISGGKKMSAGPILAIAATMYISVLALQKLFKMDLPYNWESRYWILMGIFGALGLLTLAIGQAGKDSGGAMKAAGTILAMSAFIVTAVAALMVLSLIPGDKLLKGAISLGAILLALGGALYGAGKIAEPKAYKSVIAMATVVGVIAASLGVLSLIPAAKLLTAAVALGSVLVALAVSFTSVSKISSDKSLGPITLMTAVLLEIAGILYILSEKPWDRMLGASTAMSLTILAFSELMRRISKSSGIKAAKIGAFVLGTLALIPMALALYVLAHQPWDQLLAAGVALSAVVLSFGETMTLISKSRGISVEKIGTFILATLALIPIGVALYALADKPWEGMLAAAGAISLTLIALSGVMLVCSTIGPMASLAIQGLGVLALAIGGLTLVIAALGALMSDATVSNFITNGVDAFGMLGTAIGSFVGNIVGGFAAGLTSGLEEIGQNLSKFMDSASGFFEGSKNIDATAMQGVKYLAESMLILTATSVLEQLTSWFTGHNNLVAFGKELEEFAPHFKNYYSKVKYIDGSVVEASANASKALAEMARKLPNSGGLAAKIFGDNSLSDFGKELESFGPHLAKYADDIKDLKPEAVEASANAAKIMADLAKGLPNSGGLSAVIFGDNSLSDFGKELESFGPHLAKYCEQVQDVNPAAVEASSAAVSVLSDLAKGLPNSGGIVSWFTGDNTMRDFGTNLSDFGFSLKTYFETISQITWTTFDQAIEEVKALINLADLAKNSDASTVSTFLNSFKDIGPEGVQNFISAFSDSSGNVSGAIGTFVTSAINTFKGKSELFRIEGLNAATKYLEGLRSQNGLGTTVGTTFVTLITTSIRAKLSMFLTEGRNAATKYLEGLRAMYATAKTTGITFATNAQNGIASVLGNFTIAGSNAGQGFVNGINRHAPSAQNVGRSLSNAAVAGCESGTGDWYTIGSNAARGYVAGIQSQIAAAQNAAYQLANAVPNTSTKALKIHSPSRVMQKIGDFTGLGFVNRILRYAVLAGKAGQKMAESSVEGAEEGLYGFKNLTPVYVETDLSIKPTVDLSNVERSAAETNKLFNEAVSVSAQNASLTGSFVTKKKVKNGINNEDQNDSTRREKVINQYSMTQNNYSPKALSRIDIYRDTRNQFTQFKEAIDKK